jgi:PAS domain S-box-containing protein
MQSSIGIVHTIRSTLALGALRLGMRDLPTIAGGAAVAVGITVLLGWLFGLDILKSLVPGLLTMKVNTALAFVLLGVGLFLSSRATTARDRRIGVLPVVAAMVLAALVGSQYLIGRDLGIDQWLFYEAPGQVGTVQPNRMSPMTVICFLLVGSGLILATFRHATRTVPALLIATLSLAALNVFDFLFDAIEPAMFAGYTQLALTTALTMILVAIGTMGLLPNGGFLQTLTGPSTSAQLARRLLVASLVVPVLLAWLRLEGEELGLYGTRYGISLMSLATFVLLSFVIARNSRWGQRIETARQALIEERDRYFDVSMELLATASAGGYFIRLNPAWTAVLGYELDELMARPFVEFVHPDDQAATSAEAAREINEGKSVLNFQNRYRHRDGSYRWLEWTSSPSADGALLYAAARDVTERKLEEARLGAPAMALARRRAEAMDRIESTIEARAFGPVYQPIVDLSTGAAVGYEALTRFTDGSRPDLMFATALECGLGIKLETATLAIALDGARRLPPRTWLSLNVSPPLLADVETLRATLGLRARPLVLEITEHEPIEAYGPLREAVLRLGPDVRLAVDDAGAGVANFHHLVELRPDFVKIDVSLVRGVDTDLSRQAVVAGILHFAAATHCQVIAEGIETEAELAMVTELGVSLGQGYLLGRPAPAETWSEGRTASIRPIEPSSANARGERIAQLGSRLGTTSQPAARPA